MEFEIKTITDKKLIGLRKEMTLTNNQTHQLWSSFMPRRREIINPVSTDLYSVQAYDSSYDFINFNPSASFEKWAAVEVVDFNSLPSGMEALILPAGLCAIFHYKGAANEFMNAFHYIFAEWLPHSNYALDHRPHFEIMGEKYKGNDPTSEEEIYIPVKAR